MTSWSRSRACQGLSRRTFTRRMAAFAEMLRGQKLGGRHKACSLIRRDAAMRRRQARWRMWRRKIARGDRTKTRGARLPQRGRERGRCAYYARWVTGGDRNGQWRGCVMSRRHIPTGLCSRHGFWVYGYACVYACVVRIAPSVECSHRIREINTKRGYAMLLKSPSSGSTSRSPSRERPPPRIRSAWSTSA